MKTGRPTLYTEELAEEICQRVALGETLMQIAQADGMPHRSTVWLWQEENPEFFDMLQRAREWQAISFVDEIIELADDPELEQSHERIQATKLRIDTRKWIASKYGKAIFGDVGYQLKTGQNRGLNQDIDPHIAGMKKTD